jgi:hypothetical protein
MALIMNDLLLNQLKTISLEHSDKTKFSILIGTQGSENKLTAYTVMHFSKPTERKSSLVFPSDVEFNQLKALKFMLPFNLNIIGIVFYTEEEISEFNLKILKDKENELPALKVVANVGKKDIFYYYISAKKPIKLEAQDLDLPVNNLLNFIHTLEFETSDEILTRQTELKEKSFSSIDILWDKITFNKDEYTDLKSLQAARSQLDKIIEILVPCEDKELSSKTEEGNVFLAFDLHMNYFVSEAVKNKKLHDIKEQLNTVLKQDLLIKLQRAVFDENIKRLILPAKIPLKFFGLELNAYLLKDNPSQFEYDLCLSLIKHAEISASIGFELQARILLKDLNEYFQILDDKEKQKEISELLTKLSK